MEQNNKRRAEDAERLPAEKLEWEAPVVHRQTFAEIMPKREAFIKHCEARGLDTSIQKDAWGAHIFAHSHIQAMWEGWFSATAPATPAPVVVEDVTAAGAQWGVSFAGANPEAKDYVACTSMAEAERLIAAPAVDAAKLDDLGKLKALAEAAGGDQWSDDEDVVFGADGGSVCICHANIGAMPNAVYPEHRAAFIARANPAAILRIAALVAQQAARIEELTRASVHAVSRDAVAEVIVGLHRRMKVSYEGDPVRRITFMDMDAVHAGAARLGIGGCLDAALEEGK